MDDKKYSRGLQDDPHRGGLTGKPNGPMGIVDIFGYDRHGTVTELATSLNKGRLSAYHITLAALGFNAPAWVAASSMSILYAMVAHAAPLSIAIAYVFPMLILAMCLVRLVRAAPSAAGVFTYVDRFLHPGLGMLLGWTYVVMAAAVAPMTAVIGAEYIQALVPAVAGDISARIIGTILIALFVGISLKGVELTARVAGTFLFFEILVVGGLGLCGILDPQVKNVSFAKMYSVSTSGGWTAMGQGILFGVWMLANFDSAINYIEEARVPVRTVQRALLLVLTLALIIYTLAAVGWQLAVPVERLSQIVESGNGGPIAVVARVYLPRSLTWIALFVVITSSCAGMQVSLNSGARTLYRMASEGQLPVALARINRSKAPSSALLLTGLAGTLLVWLKPLAAFVWYYDAITITLVMTYSAMLAAYIGLVWTRHRPVAALPMSILPVVAIIVLLFVGYTAGATPADPSDRFNAWYIGAGVLGTGLLLEAYKGKHRGRACRSACN